MAEQNTFRSYFITSPGVDLQCLKINLDEIIANLSADGVLIKVCSAGVCHSDLHQWEGGYRLSETEEIRFSDRDGYGFPKVPGHEVSGTVYAFGKNVQRLGIGDQVCIYAWMGCGVCEMCLNEEDCFCAGSANELGFCIDGGYAEYVLIPHHRYILPLPKSISMDLGATLSCSCLTAYNACKAVVSNIPEAFLNNSSVELKVGVIGVGGLGQWALELLPLIVSQELCRKLSITGIDINREKLESLKTTGLIQNTFPIVQSLPIEKQAEELIARVDSPYHAVIDFVNDPKTFDLGVRLIGNGGVLVPVGLFGGTGTLQLPLVALKRRRIIGIHTGTLKEFKKVLKFVEANASSIKGPEITHYKLEDCTKALTDLKERKVTGRAVLKIADY